MKLSDIKFINITFDNENVRVETGKSISNEFLAKVLLAIIVNMGEDDLFTCNQIIKLLKAHIKDLGGKVEK